MLNQTTQLRPKKKPVPVKKELKVDGWTTKAIDMGNYMDLKSLFRHTRIFKFTLPQNVFSAFGKAEIKLPLP